MLINKTEKQLIQKYYSGRFYHNEDHIYEMLTGLRDLFLEKKLTEKLKKAIIFHDSIYDPRCSDNEEKSCLEFTNIYPNDPDKNDIIELIMVTKTHKYSQDHIKNIMIDLDLGIFKKELSNLLDYEIGIFKEYQFAEINEYIKKRTDFLKKLKIKLINRKTYSDHQLNNIDLLIKHIQDKKYKIGIYPGSFSPFHIGHKNILEKAEKIFDKVIIAKGINHNKVKGKEEYDLPERLLNEKIYYNGLVTDLFERKHSNISYYLIRGLRNAQDYFYEESFRKTILSINSEIQFVYIPSDPQYEHISSSVIREVNQFNPNVAKKWLIDPT